jgi:hypothetical protein
VLLEDPLESELAPEEVDGCDWMAGADAAPDAALGTEVGAIPVAGAELSLP